MNANEIKKIQSYILSLGTFPEQKLCPDTILKWTISKNKVPMDVYHFVKSGRHYVDEKLQDGVFISGHIYQRFWLDAERKEISMLPNRIWEISDKDSITTAKKQIFSYYAKYHEKIDALQIAEIYVDAHRAEDGDKRRWKYSDFYEKNYFFFHKTGDVFQGPDYLPKDGMYYHRGVAHWLQSEIAQKIFNRHFHDEVIQFTKQLSTAIGYSGEQKVKWLHPYRFNNYYKNIEIRKEAKNNIKKDLIEGKNLSGRNLENTPYEKAIDSLGVVAICEKYGDGAVVRCYKKVADTMFAAARTIIEVQRWYFDDKQCFVLENVYRTGHWKQVNINNNYLIITEDNAYFNFNFLLDIPRFKDLYNAVTQTWNPVFFLTPIYQCYKWPIMEKLLKAGYPQITIKLKDNTNRGLKHYFGTTSKKTGSLYQNLNMNKIQLKYIEEQLANRQTNMGGYTLPEMEFLKNLGGDDIRHWDEKKSRKILGFAMAVRMGYWNMGYSINQFGAVVENHSNIPTKESCKQFKNLINLYTRTQDSSVIYLYRDTIGCMTSLGEVLPNMDPNKARSKRELEWMHDVYLEAANKKRYEKNIDMDKWDRLNKKRIEIYQDVGKKFEIVVPEKPLDIVHEGASLHHCVAGYVDKVAAGKTTILFLRKVSEPLKSFYTIEVQNSRIVQIHGNYNQWLGNNPEAIQFVIDWLGKTKIYCEKNILLSTGKGYGGSRNEVSSSDYTFNEYVL